MKKGQAHNIRYSIWRNSDDALLILDGTTEQCCNIVGITPKTLWNLASSGGSDKYTVQKSFMVDEQTCKAEKILSGKRKRALAAIGNSKRVMPDGLIYITKQEAKTLGKWIEELEERVAIMMECQSAD